MKLLLYKLQSGADFFYLASKSGRKTKFVKFKHYIFLNFW